MAVQKDLEAPLMENKGTSSKIWHFLRILGPGLVCGLADSDPGGLFTMAVDGSSTGYALLSMQLLLIPVLYMVQEMVARLTVCKQKGILLQVRENTGIWTYRLFAFAMTFEGTIAMVAEFAGFAAAGEICGLGREWSCLAGGLILITVVLVSDYHRLERIGMALGSCLLVFVLTVFLCRPPVGEVAYNAMPGPQMLEAPLPLVFENIGTVVTPWMLFFQGGAIISKGLKIEDLHMERVDTLVGATLTQFVMCCVLITFAMMMPGRQIENATVSEVFLPAMAPLLGDRLSVILVTAGLLGAAMLAAMVISLGVAWNLTEAAGGSISAEEATTSPTFRKFFIGTVGLGVFIVNSGIIGVVELNILVQLANGVIMPLVVVYIFYLATAEHILEEEHRVTGWYKYVVGSLLLFCSVLAVEQAWECVAPFFRTGKFHLT